MQVSRPQNSLSSLPPYRDYVINASGEPVTNNASDEPNYDQYYTDQEPAPKKGFGILNIIIHPVSLVLKAAGGLITLLLS